MKKLGLALVGFSLSAAVYGTSFADGSCKTLDEVEQIIKQRFTNMNVSVEKSPIPCVYELWTGFDHVLYTDGNYLFVGHILDFSGGDLTQAKIDEKVSKEVLLKVDKMDKSKLFKIGSGPVEIIEFMDPECPYCKRAEEMLKPVEDKITRYVVFMPLPFHQNAKPLTEYVLCSGTERAYKNALVGKVDLSKFKCSSERKEEVEKVMDYHMSLAQEFNIRGTPTFIIKTSEGYRIIPGANPEILDIIESQLSSTHKGIKDGAK